ncbi:helix-turn-helix domain-containing protein, partial [Klebsiella oxytoca]
SVRNDDTQFIDITTRLNIFTYTVLKTISGSANLPAVNTVRLTDREFTVARLVLCGRSDEDIATVLSITKRSSQDHINRVLKKLGGKSVADIYLHRNVIYGSCSAR